MDINGVRRENLNSILSELGGERPTAGPLIKRILAVDPPPSVAEAKHRKKTLSNQIHQWVHGARQIGSRSARLIERAAGKAHGWMDVSHGTEPQGAGNTEAGLPLDLLVRRHAYDIDQLRTTLLNVVDVLISKIPVEGVAALLLDRLTTDADAQPDPQYGDKGFHARVLGTLQTIAQTQATFGKSSPHTSNHAPSRRKRAP